MSATADILPGETAEFLVLADRVGNELEPFFVRGHELDVGTHAAFLTAVTQPRRTSQPG